MHVFLRECGYYMYNVNYLQKKYYKLRVVIYKAFCFDVAQGRMNVAPNEVIY